MRVFILAGMILLLPGCIARAAVDLVTLPVKVATGTFDKLTTSQSEADETRGRAVRKREECEGREQRRAENDDREPDYDRCR